MYQSLGQTDMFSGVAQQMMGNMMGHNSSNDIKIEMSMMTGLMGQTGPNMANMANQNNNQPINPTQARLQF